jgi:hypothetical protein
MKYQPRVLGAATLSAERAGRFAVPPIFRIWSLAGAFSGDTR